VHAEALAIFGTIVADLFFNCWDLEVLPDCLVRYIPRCAHHNSQSLFDRKRSNISMLDVDVMSQSCIP
jgi:hypothetical protein